MHTTSLGGSDLPRPRPVLVIPLNQFSDPVLQSHLGFPVQALPRARDVRPSGCNISGVGGAEVKICFLPNQILDDVNGIYQNNRTIRAKIDNGVTGWQQPRNGAIGDIVDVCEVTRLLPVSENDYRLFFAYPLNKSEQTHVWPTARTIHRKVT